jgi:uncharacterized protein YkwD
MAQHDYYAHDLLGGVTPWENMADHGYRYTTPKGENIAASMAGARAAFRAWKGSPGHRANMLDADFKAIGIGRAYGADSEWKWYWTTDFGGYRDAAVAC